MLIVPLCESKRSMVPRWKLASVPVWAQTTSPTANLGFVDIAANPSPPHSAASVRAHTYDGVPRAKHLSEKPRALMSEDGQALGAESAQAALGIRHCTTASETFGGSHCL